MHHTGPGKSSRSAVPHPPAAAQSSKSPAFPLFQKPPVPAACASARSAPYSPDPASEASPHPSADSAYS